MYTMYIIIQQVMFFLNRFKFIVPQTRNNGFRPRKYFFRFFFIFILDLKNHFDFFLIFIYESCDQIRIKISYR
jgi:hypothetical protein